MKMKFRTLSAEKFPERARYKEFVVPLERGEVVQLSVSSKQEAYMVRASVVSSLKRWLPTERYKLRSHVSDKSVDLKIEKVK